MVNGLFIQGRIEYINSSWIQMDTGQVHGIYIVVVLSRSDLQWIMNCLRSFSFWIDNVARSSITSPIDVFWFIVGVDHKKNAIPMCSCFFANWSKKNKLHKFLFIQSSVSSTNIAYCKYMNALWQKQQNEEEKKVE